MTKNVPPLGHNSYMDDEIQKIEEKKYSTVENGKFGSLFWKFRIWRTFYYIFWSREPSSKFSETEKLVSKQVRKLQD